MCHFSSFLLLSDSCSVLATLSSPTSFLLPQALWQIWQELSSLSPPVLSGYNGIPGHSFLPGNDAADELARGVALLVPSTIPCSLSPLVSRIQSSLFSEWRHTVSSKFFRTQVPSISTEELVLPCHACCVLSLLRCNGHSLLLSSYLSRIGRIENPSCSACGHSTRTPLILFCTVQIRTLSTAHSLATLCLLATSGPDPGELLGFWGSMVFMGNNNNNNISLSKNKMELQNQYKNLDISLSFMQQTAYLTIVFQQHSDNLHAFGNKRTNVTLKEYNYCRVPTKYDAHKSCLLGYICFSLVTGKHLS